jgi:hypothetical protein
MPRRTVKHVSDPAVTPKKRARMRADARQAAKQQSIGLVEAKMAPVLPRSYLDTINNPQYMVHPNWTQMQLNNEGEGSSSGWWDQVNADGSAFLQPSDGGYGLLSYRANLGTERAKKFIRPGQSDAYEKVMERAWSTLALPKSLISGDHTYLKRLHLFVNLKYLTPAPYSTELLQGNMLSKVIRQPPPVRVRVLLVKVKRDNMGLPMYALDRPISGLTKGATENEPTAHRLDYSDKNDNPVSTDLLLDPVGNPFGVDQLTQREPTNETGGTLLATTNLHDTYNTAGNDGLSKPRNVKKNQPNWMHFSQPVQKKFFDVLASETFMLGPEYTQSNAGAASAANAEKVTEFHTGESHPSVKYMKFTIPINERVEYKAWTEEQGSDALPTPYKGPDFQMQQPGLDLMIPKDKAFFDYKLIAMAYCPSDTQESWKQRLNAYLRGPSAAAPTFSTQDQMGMSFSSCPCITLNHYGVLETLDNE